MRDIKLPYACQYCPKEFARPHEKVKHERVHTGDTNDNAQENILIASVILLFLRRKTTFLRNMRENFSYIVLFDASYENSHRR